MLENSLINGRDATVISDTEYLIGRHCQEAQKKLPEKERRDKHEAYSLLGPGTGKD
jgi:hypothetical protein